MEKKMDLAGSVRVNNNSGEDYENAQVRLVVGIIHLVENIADLARRGRPGAIPPPSEKAAGVERTVKFKVAEAKMLDVMKMGEARPRQIIKEGVSEYFLYTVEGRDTIPNGWSKRLPSFKAQDVPLVSYYTYERER